LHISNFRPVKRTLDCIRIFDRVLARVPQARLLMAGDGPERGPAEMLALELGINARVEFLGKPDHIERLIPQARGQDGFLEPVGDIAAQADRAVALLEDPELHARFARAARATAEQRFDSRRIIPQYENLYQEVCEAVPA